MSHMHVHTCIYVHPHCIFCGHMCSTHLHACAHMCAHGCGMCTHAYVMCMYTCLCVYAQTCMHMHLYVCGHVHLVQMRHVVFLYESGQTCMGAEPFRTSWLGEISQTEPGLTGSEPPIKKPPSRWGRVVQASSESHAGLFVIMCPSGTEMPCGSGNLGAAICNLLYPSLGPLRG